MEFGIIKLTAVLLIGEYVNYVFLMILNFIVSMCITTIERKSAIMMYSYIVQHTTCPMSAGGGRGGCNFVEISNIPTNYLHTYPTEGVFSAPLSTGYNIAL